MMSNGLLERTDTTMINVLITIPHNFKANSKDRLARLSFACNSAVNKSTGFTCFYLMFERKLGISVLEKIYCYATLKKKKVLES